MYWSPSAVKFAFAVSLPALFVLLAMVGGDRWDGFGLFAGLLAIAGAICMAQATARAGHRFLAGIAYVVVIGLLLLVLP